MRMRSWFVATWSVLALVISLVAMPLFTKSAFTKSASAQSWRAISSTGGTVIGHAVIVPMKSAPFPHPKRASGHSYDGKSYPVAEHYRDSSVMIFLPSGFQPQKTLDFVVYLHGWYNSIDSANAQFRIAEQFAESRRNAVLVFPEGPKFAPDSFAGKLEDSCGLQRLLQETLETLLRTKNIRSTVGNAILAGHSGAYRGMAYMLARGRVPVREVWLFDALYGQTEKYTHWLETDVKRLRGRFITIYTDDGGTKAETEKLVEDLTAWNVSFRLVEEQTLTKQDLMRSSVLFIHTDLQHNDVISRRGQFRLFLETSCLHTIR
jgi:hypothetical protein